MILNKKKIIERHANGVLAYHCTWAEVGPLFFGQIYSCLGPNENGNYLIRVGRCAKYYDNGQLAWKLLYENNGQVRKGSHEAYRRDGQRIVA